MILKPGDSGTSGALAADKVFYVAAGVVQISTDAGATKIPFYGPEYSTLNIGDKVVISSGLTALYYNERNKDAELRIIPI